MYKARPNEPEYALLHDPVSQETNRYGKSIETVASNSELRGHSLNINDDIGAVYPGE